MKTRVLRVPAAHSHRSSFSQNMFTAGFTSNTYSEYVFLCVRSPVCVCVCDHCLSFNNRLSVAISGGRGPGDLASPCDWLAHCCERASQSLSDVYPLKFTLEGAVCWIFSTPIKCGMQSPRRPFEVCCVCLGMCVCLFVSVPSSFIFTHRGLSAETRQPPEQVRWDLKPSWLCYHAVVHVGLIQSVFGIVTLGGKEDAANTTAN